MDNKQSRCVGPVGHDQVGQIGRRSGRQPRSSWSIRGRFTIGVFRILAVLGLLGLVSTESAWAQDTPAKKAIVEVPRQPAPAEAPLDALSLRYRFTEKYSSTEEPEKPEVLTQYQVGSRATYKTVTEKPQGAPEQSEKSSQLIYTERAAKVSKIGELTHAVRRYDTFRIKGIPPARLPKQPWLEGLTLWYHRQPSQDPEILSLTQDRRLREIEFDQIVGQVFLPQLTAVFPPTPMRVGDTWNIPLNAARNLLGDTPDPEGYALKGTLNEVRKDASGAQTAEIGISGQYKMVGHEYGVNTRIFFHIVHQVTISTPGEKTVELRGWVSQVLMAQSEASFIPETDHQLKETVTLDLNVARRRQPAADAKDAPLFVPDIAPTANEDNSWLVYDDPRGQFHFRHPQDLRIAPRQVDPNIVELVDRQFRGYYLGISLWPKETDPERDRKSRDPDIHRRDLYSQWEEQKRDIVKGPSGWLPEAVWSPLQRKVYRIEVADQKPGGGPNTLRLYCDYYLVLFATSQKVVVRAMTHEDHLKFRNQTEAVIKSFTFGPSEGQPTSPAATPAPAPKPPL